MKITFNTIKNLGDFEILRTCGKGNYKQITARDSKGFVLGYKRTDGHGYINNWDKNGTLINTIYDDESIKKGGLK